VTIWGEPDPDITLEQHKMDNVDLQNAQVVIGSPKKSYRFSLRNDEVFEKVNVKQTLQFYNVGFKE